MRDNDDLVTLQVCVVEIEELGLGMWYDTEDGVWCFCPMNRDGTPDLHFGVINTFDYDVREHNPETYEQNVAILETYGIEID